jgi:glycosyltransferase involved in cell wall biosynthesis
MKVRVVTSDRSTVATVPLEFEQKRDNPRIEKISIPAIEKSGILSRMGYHVRYIVKTAFHAWKTPNSDIVIASIPTLFVGWIGFFVSIRHNAAFVLDVRDLWADSLATTSLAKIPFFLDVNLWIERKLYSLADVICCTSRSQVKTIKTMASSGIPVAFVPNGIDPEVREPSMMHPFMIKIRERYRWVGLYAGKHTKYTDLGNLIDAAQQLADQDFALVLLGGGYTRKGLQERAEKEGIQNVFFHEPVPKSEVATFEFGADLFFINYSPEKAWAKVLPNKVFDYMYWNKPIVAAVVPGEITRIIDESEAGLSVTPQDPHSLSKAVSNLISNGQTRVQCRDFLFSNFDRRKTVMKFVNMIEKIR